MKTNEKETSYVAPIEKTIVIKTRNVLCGSEKKPLDVEDPFYEEEAEEVM